MTTRAMGVRFRTVFAVSVFALVVCFLAAGAAAQTLDERLRSEIARIRGGLSEPTDAQAIRRQVTPSVKATLDRAEKDLAAGRTFLALRALSSARMQLTAMEYVESQLGAVGTDKAKFQAEWRRFDGELKPVEAAYGEMQWANAPAVVRALAESAWAETRVYYDAASPYGEVDSAMSGLYYMGVARGSLEYARYCKSLPFAGAAARGTMRSIAGEMDRMDARIGEAYKPPRSIERHPEFINMNAMLKRATELDARGLYFGAMYSYLETVRMLEEMLGSAPTQEELAKLETANAALAVKLADLKRDHSIGALYMELAERELERGKAGEADSAKRAKVVLEQVLPAYFAALARPDPKRRAGETLVRVTLVRWPYT